MMGCGTARRRVVLASGNAGKLVELQTLLADLPVDLIPQHHWAVPEAAEISTTFVENALHKARHAARHTGLPAIADDSGIAVDALGGAPGVYSARFAGPDADDAANLDLLLERAAAIPAGERHCQFYCAVVYLSHAEDPCPEICTGHWLGELAFSPRGANGFGYDPIFHLPERHCTSAELPSDIKNAISHRGQAVAALRRALLARYLPP